MQITKDNSFETRQPNGTLTGSNQVLFCYMRHENSLNLDFNN